MLNIPAKDPTMLYTEAILKEDFEGLKINVLNTPEGCNLSPTFS